jgi:WbqC-like protein family
MLQEASTLSIDLQYFPCVNWFKDSIAAGRYLFHPEEHFRRSSFRNRMLVPGSNGVIALSIPVTGGRGTILPYNQVLIDYKSSWQRDHFRTIESVYGNSPFFFQYRDELQALYGKKIDGLFNWNLTCLEWISGKIGIVLPIENTQSILTNNFGRLPMQDKYKPANFDEPVNGPFVKYPQVFEDRLGFKSNMSIIDLLFNTGPAITKQILFS